MSGSPVKSKARDRLRLAPLAVQRCANLIKKFHFEHCCTGLARALLTGLNELHITCGGTCGLQKLCRPIFNPFLNFRLHVGIVLIDQI